MFNFIHLNCPTCGAQLRVSEDSQRFDCEHCGNNYLLSQKISELEPAERENILADSTYTHKLKQWLKVGDYEICLHEIQTVQQDGLNIFAISVEYRNNSKETLSCRRNQWTLFDPEGYAYDNDENDSKPYECLPGQMLGNHRILTPGSKVRGWVTFKLPTGTTVERLQFLTGNFSAKTAEYLLK
jgi:DNA-directed RNA polymerase subunit RPC12/RpoP